MRSTSVVVRIVVFVSLISLLELIVGCGGGGSGIFEPAPDFSLAVSCPSQQGTTSIQQGASGTCTVTATAIGGFSGSIALSVSNLPSGVATTFSSTSIVPGGSSTLTINVGSSVATGKYTFSVTGASGTLTHSVSVGLTVTEPLPTVTPLLPSVNVFLGQVATVGFTTTENPTKVTCSVASALGSCVVASSSVSYTAPTTTPTTWNTEIDLTATNDAGSTTAKITVQLGQLTNVTASPSGPVPLAMNMTYVFTATVEGNGTFPSTVTWDTVPAGMGSFVASAASEPNEDSATYTPPQGLPGFTTVTIRATGADGATIGTTTVNVGFSWVFRLTPNGAPARMTAAGALSADGTKVLAADARTADANVAGLVLCDPANKSCSDVWTDSVTSSINSIAAGPSAWYVAGSEADKNGVNRAMLLQVTLNGSAVQVSNFVPDLQTATGTRTEGAMIKVDSSNNVYLGVNGDCPPGSSSSSCVNTGSWIYTYTSMGTPIGNFPVAASFPIVLTGVDVEPGYIGVRADVFTVSGNLTSDGLLLYTHDGQLINDQTGDSVYHAKLFLNGAGDQLLSGGQVKASATDSRFGLDSTPIVDNLIDPYAPWFFAVWDGNNDGTINTAEGAVPNPWGGGDVLGALAPVVGSTSSNTDAGVVSWYGSPTPGYSTPIFWALRVDLPHAPGGPIYTWSGSVYYNGMDGKIHDLLFGRGSLNGINCAVVADYIPDYILPQ